jgi:hypothetical protein
MTDLVELSQYYSLADQLIEKASKKDIAETAKLLALNLAYYKMKYGELPLDETLAMIDIDNPTLKNSNVGEWHGGLYWRAGKYHREERH